MVGADFSKMDFKKQNWFHEFEWTEDSENDFKKWLISYLLENKEALAELMQWPRKDKKTLARVADEFVFQYGWKYKKF
jgi:hypothetical protein